MEQVWPEAWATPPAGRLKLPRRLLRHDLALMWRLARWRAPRWVRIWMVSCSRGGDGPFWIGAGAGVLLFGGRPRYAAFGCALLAAALGVACFVALKTWVRRPRPAGPWSAPGAHRARFWKRVAPSYRDEFSFPSGHTLTGFAVATALLPFYPELGLCLLGCACSVAASRLVLGFHFLSDVIAGCLIGIAMGLGSVMLLAR